MKELEIVYQDEYLLAVNKPAGLLVHRSELSTETENVVKILRKQLKRKVYPVHRLDRATSGVLLFALNPDVLKSLSTAFEKKEVQKIYYTVVRGFTKDSETIDYPLINEDTQKKQESVTAYRTLARIELPYAVGRYPTARYSLVQISPLTGRRHQLRKHFHHISHHIIGDTTYGDGKHNLFFREQFGINRLLLMAVSLAFKHPVTGEPLKITAPLDPQVIDLFKQFNWLLPFID